MDKFLQDRIRLVRELLASDIDVAYPDVVLILTAVLSACAARRWPGRRIDRARFIELLVRHSPADAHTSWVSVPALIYGGLVTEADTPYGEPGQATRIFRDDEIDLDLQIAQRKYARVCIRDLKRWTYAAIIYEWLRCGYAHEYRAHENHTSFAPSRHDARVSYIGRGVPGAANEITRIVSFHLDYLIELTEYHASSVPDTPSPIPAQWWIDAA